MAVPTSPSFKRTGTATVIDALMRVQMESEVPVISAVLTPQAFHEHVVHRRFFAEHAATKGVEAAEACLQTLATLATIRGHAA
ncbi:MAG: hypothetical protein FJX36_04390 [Alphaproteobacteria bacterium]|nr:hypothetical protein [Alphaproteobacteria bacterium]